MTKLVPLAVAVYVQAVRELLNLVWDPIIKFGPHPVDLWSIYTITGLNCRRRCCRWIHTAPRRALVLARALALALVLFHFRQLRRHYRIALWQVPVSPNGLALDPAPNQSQQYKEGADAPYWHTASQRHAAPCGFCDTTSRSTLPSYGNAAQPTLAGTNNSKSSRYFIRGTPFLR